MRLSSLLPLSFAVLAFGSAPSRRSYDTHEYYVLHLDSDAPPEQVALRLGLAYDGPLGELDHLHLYSTPKTDAPGSEDVVRDALRRRRLAKRSPYPEPDLLDGVRMAKKQVLRKPWTKREIVPPLVRDVGNTQDQATVQRQTALMKELSISDPIFQEQWHLVNTIQVGHDINVTGCWQQGITGKGVIVSMVDDGLDMDSEDLKENYYAEGSYDFNDHTFEPRPRLSDDHHGTRCAGEIAAVRNNVCGVGVAYDAKISGIRILSKLITDADEAIAMTYDFQHNMIYSCSWGPPDDGRSMEAPGILIRQAMLKGIQDGRGGKGSIYVFASGNGAMNDDNCNFDGYTNSIYSITVGAIDRTGAHPYYSEKCSAQLVVTYSSGSGDAIHTTDVGANKCFTGHGGTSAAAPLGAGIFALVLQVNPDLTWRDMQYIVMNSAVPLNLESGEWVDTYAGRKFSHTFGYGKIDSFGAVELAKSWKLVKPQAWYFSPWIHVNKPIPQGQDGLVTSFEVTADMLKEANLERVEHVTITMNVNHTRRGDLSADLISPEGVVSHISTTRRMDSADTGYMDWTFMSVVHWGEPGVGKWTVVLKDSTMNDFEGVWTDWRIKLWGECIDPTKATMLPMPTEEDDDDHANIETTTATVATTSIIHTAPSDTPITTPTDHPDRPTKIRPTTPATASPTQTGTAQEPPSSWISWLPTFGVSSSAQVWIYGAMALIILFCCGLGIYLYLARRRRRLNNPRDDYEFELINEEEPEGEKALRGGELYDAFAGGSDDEADDVEDDERRHMLSHHDDQGRQHSRKPQ